MPTVIDAPELVEQGEYIETHDLDIETLEQPQARPARPGFWRTLVHSITTYLTPTPRERQVSVCRAYRPYEAPMDRFIRENPSLALYALAMI